MLGNLAVSPSTYWSIVFDYVMSSSSTSRSLASKYGLSHSTILSYLRKTASLDSEINAIVVSKANLNKNFDTQGTYKISDEMYTHLMSVRKRLLTRKTMPPNITDYIWKNYHGKFTKRKRTAKKK